MELVLLLLCLCSYCYGQECRVELQKDTSFMAYVLETKFSPEVSHCQLLCTQHPRCQFFMYYTAQFSSWPQRFHCALKSTSSGRPMAERELPGVISGYSLKPCPVYSAPCFRLYRDLAFLQGNLRSLFTPDATECQRVCTHEPGCTHFTWTTPQHKATEHRFRCYLHFSWTVPRILLVKEQDDVISGFSPRADFRTKHGLEVCAARFMLNTDLRQGATEISKEVAVSPEHCQALCSAHPLCTHYTFNRTYCFLLKKTNSASTKTPGLISGLSAHFCHLDNSWQSKLYPGLGFPGSDLKMVSATDVKSCQKTCDEDNLCQFFTFVLKGRCYLKAVITAPAPEKIIDFVDVVSGFSLTGQ